MRPYLRAANITWSGLDLSDVKEMNFNEAESATYELHPGDVLVAEASGSASEVGKPAIWRGEISGCCFQNTLLRVRARHCEPEFLRYFLLYEAESGRIGKASPGVGIHHIGAARLSAWRVPLAPVAEQRRIVAAIDEHLSRLDAGESSLVRGNARLRALSAGLIESATAAYSKVEFGSLVTDLRYGTSIKCARDADGPPVIRIPNVARGEVDLGDIKFATEAGADLSAFTLQRGDLLFVRTNGSRDLIGRVALADRAVGMAFASYLIRARPDPSRLDPRFAVIALVTAGSRAHIESHAATSAGQYNLNLGSLRSIPTPLPPIEEQRRIAAEVDTQLASIEQVRSSIEHIRHRLASLRRSVFERAFAGCLVSQNLSDEPASALLDRVRTERAAKREPSVRRRVRA
jgi:type I restriction enzyme S subunit